MTNKNPTKTKAYHEPQNLDNYIDSDASDEDVLVKVGNVPIKWYENFKHLGYDKSSSKVLKQQQDDKLDDLIKKTEDKNWWKSIKDELNNQNVILSDEQLQLLDRIRQGKMALPSTDQQDLIVEYPWDGRFAVNEKDYLPKRKFQPSKWERMKVNKLVSAIKLGWLKPKKPESEPEEHIYDIWENAKEDEVMRRKMPPALSAPKMKLPGNEESYNPPDEYLFDEEELKAWQVADPEDRETNFIPKKYPVLRKVEAYEGLIKERFERCLDLYLCPRARVKKLNIDPEALVPEIPKPSDLRPFPTSSNIVYSGHTAEVISIDTDKNGQFMCSCQEDGLLIIWDVRSSRKLQEINLGSATYSLAWAKNESSSLLAICSEERITIINPKMLSSKFKEANEEKINAAKTAYDNNPVKLLNWNFNDESDEKYTQGFRINIQLTSDPKFITFHSKGDYFGTVSPGAPNNNDQVFIHSLSKGGSQRPFNKSKGKIQKIEFHRTKPVLFLMTQRNIYVYNLQQQSLTKKLFSGAVLNNAMNIHPKGDNILIGTSDNRVMWFDLDLDNKPYKIMKYHKASVNQVNYHSIYPLFATASHDGSINIFHGYVYDDLMKNALIVPLKILKGHSIINGHGVLDIKFHPNQPWIFSAGADKQIIMWT